MPQKLKEILGYSTVEDDGKVRTTPFNAAGALFCPVPTQPSPSRIHHGALRLTREIRFMSILQGRQSGSLINRTAFPEGSIEGESDSDDGGLAEAGIQASSLDSRMTRKSCTLSHKSLIEKLNNSDPTADSYSFRGTR